MPSSAGHKFWGRIKYYQGETPALVAVITRKKDFNILKEQGWYRIPVKSAPEFLGKIKYIAFYQTKIFGPERWAVNYYAEVKGIKMARRFELLPDEPRHKMAQDDYYKVEIGSLQKLPNPIPSRRWRRIVFIPTTLERLFRAKEINDLYHTSPIEEKLYQELDRLGFEPERQFFTKEQNQGYFLDLAIFCRDGNLDVECDGAPYHSGRKRAAKDRLRDNSLTAGGWHILRFSGKEINQDTKGCIQLIAKAVRALGGTEKVKS
ncbi:MAG: DUF559 domain-containing protein [candidate division WOR-3 bacterium]